MSRSVLFVTHTDSETGGVACRWLGGLPMQRMNMPTQAPDLDSIAGIVIFGGDMSVADEAEHPSLRVTAQLALDAIDAEVPVLALCLGHQIVGRALGGELQVGVVNEAGLVDVQLHAPDPYLGNEVGTIRPVQWHRDVVTLPPGATLLASNTAVANQGFRYGSAVGLQFHLEADDTVIEQWATEESPPIDEGYPAGTWKQWRNAYRGDARIQSVARAGFTAFAEDAQRRL